MGRLVVNLNLLVHLGLGFLQDGHDSRNVVQGDVERFVLPLAVFVFVRPGDARRVKGAFVGLVILSHGAVDVATPQQTRERLLFLLGRTGHE